MSKKERFSFRNKIKQKLKKIYQKKLKGKIITEIKENCTTHQKIKMVTTEFDFK